MKVIKEKFYDLAISDFDGTLLSSKGEVSKKTIETIQAFISRGGVFSVCTGRMTGSIIGILQKLGLVGYVISYNGAEICKVETGEKVYKNHLTPNALVKILRYAEENNFDLLVYPNDRLTVNHTNDEIKRYLKSSGANCNLINEKVSDYIFKNQYSSGKALFLTHGDLTITKKIMNDLPIILGDGYNIVNSNLYHIDVMKKGVSKGDTIKILAQITGKSMQRLICFGDEMNDESMLKVASLSAVTENGNEALKKWCDIVIDSCDDEGVRKAIEKYCI
ncbi:MAG: HAD family hydrolase [Clostridia bacterium]|nr:HAD family hydrolase [Clostridia bacterium]